MDGEDCDDDNDTIYPNAPELCDGIVNTCDGVLPDVEKDIDSDGYVECEVDVNGWKGDNILGGGDCDIESPFVYPQALELCDGIINTCGGILPDDEVDNDGDGFVECSFPKCVIGAEMKMLVGGDDCEDSNNFIFPEAPELCDGLVNDCSGSLHIDEQDLDGDGYVVCEITGDWFGDSSILDGEDCDDDNDTIYPNAPELCDGIVNTCDGVLPDVEKDIDSDGYVECEVDVNGWKGDNILGGGDCDIESPLSIHKFWNSVTASSILVVVLCY